ncbi:hypothetical protein LG200_05180 [Methylobacillus caricis]|uniref:hypothetical protein n=1 Tax=Methylobacillus caricis TaxID=1971611 RepID=UPI001CFF797A|nr:hypothetical protein [Methylobacillus caricis]MCB5187397.1 hypothetical protein [Methylobacillus caricis]
MKVDQVKEMLAQMLADMEKLDGGLLTMTISDSTSQKPIFALIAIRGADTAAYLAAINDVEKRLEQEVGQPS